MATWLLMLVITLSYLFIGATIASVWEKIERNRIDKNVPLFLVYSFEYSAYHTNYYMVCLCIIVWPIFLLITISLGIYLLIRKIVGL